MHDRRQQRFLDQSACAFQGDVQGFGTLNYFRDATNAFNEHGLYERDFTVPADWTGRRVFLVFEGVMTDTSAKLNG